MRVVMWMPLRDVPGGHQVQCDGTVRALRALGVDVHTCFAPSLDFGGARPDVVHGFGLEAGQVRQVRAAGVPVALSPIYWSHEYTSRGPGGRRSDSIRRRLTAAGVLMRAALSDTHPEKMAGYLRGRQEAAALFESADLLLPNSALETRALQEELGVTTPCMVVPNAVDHELFSPSPDGESEKAGVLMVGRFEPHKNQLALIRALAGSGIRLTLAGPEHPQHADYLARCRREAREREVRFLSARSQADLVELYRQAEVHVLPSWFETTGLVSLEAALSGTAVVTTSRGFASEYFQQDVAYCEPDDVRTIRHALRRALAAGPSAKLRERILQQFTWRQAGQATLNAYRKVAA